MFSGSPLDRAGLQRRDRKWLQAQKDADESRYLALWKLQALLRRDSPPKIAWANHEIRAAMDADTGAILLGLHEGVAHFAVDVSGLEKPGDELGLGDAAHFTDVRAAAASLPGAEAAILAQARTLIDWHANHRFCSSCGEPTRVADAGYMRVCPDCSGEHFPRTNPVAIMVVARGDKCLLGRQRGWPAGMFSALAGFIEPGETIEEAARREVLEEAGVHVGAVRYVASQPWPFPASLMIGCIAEGLSDEIVVDSTELDDARWVPRDSILRALAGAGAKDGFFVPPPMAIAHQLILTWAEGR